MPKALLPIVNQPMISYQLSWLESSGVHGTVLFMCSFPLSTVAIDGSGKRIQH